MSLVAYMRNGVQAGPMPTYFDLQPRITSHENSVARATPNVPRTTPDDFVRHRLVPSATHQHHTRQVLGLKQYPFSIRTGKDPGHTFQGVKAHQGYGRHQTQGLAFN